MCAWKRSRQLLRDDGKSQQGCAPQAQVAQRIAPRASHRAQCRAHQRTHAAAPRPKFASPNSATGPAAASPSALGGPPLPPKPGVPPLVRAHPTWRARARGRTEVTTSGVRTTIAPHGRSALPGSGPWCWACGVCNSAEDACEVDEGCGGGGKARPKSWGKHTRGPGGGRETHTKCGRCRPFIWSSTSGENREPALGPRIPVSSYRRERPSGHLPARERGERDRGAFCGSGAMPRLQCAPRASAGATAGSNRVRCGGHAGPNVVEVGQDTWLNIGPQLAPHRPTSLGFRPRFGSSRSRFL